MTLNDKDIEVRNIENGLEVRYEDDQIFMVVEIDPKDKKTYEILEWSKNPDIEDIDNLFMETLMSLLEYDYERKEGSDE